MTDGLAGNCAIAVMAKAPRPGQVKTRLSPLLQPHEAAEMSAAFLRDVTANIALASREAAISGWVAYAPTGSERLFDGMLEPGTRLVLADGATEPAAGVRGFGLCLLHAARSLLGRGAAAVCLLNSDSPTLPTTLLVEAARLLAAPGDRVVLGPAEDGGYYLLGFKRPHAGLFAEIAWSTELVAAQTRERVAGLELELVELAAWYDVDDPAALRRLVKGMDGGVLLPYPAPSTTGLVARLGLAQRLEA
jgi:rSAM/selenodomain-associated transferase 1